jgi:hypothetical protein
MPTKINKPATSPIVPSFVTGAHTQHPAALVQPLDDVAGVDVGGADGLHVLTPRWAISWAPTNSV